MANLTVDVPRNVSGKLAAELPRLIRDAIRKQVFVTEGDVKLNIRKYDYIDTGATLNSVRGEMTGAQEGMVSVGTEYAVYGNYGTRYQAARPFLTEAEIKAREEFGPRVRAEIEGAF